MSNDSKCDVGNLFPTLQIIDQIISIQYVIRLKKFENR